MTEKRKVRGLADMPAPDAEEIKWEMEEISPDFIPGIGLGATEEVKRWAWIGYNEETKLRISALPRTPRGRPRKEAIATKDSFRAYVLWNCMRNIRRNHPEASFTNRELICVARKIEQALSIPLSECAFSAAGNFEASVSRGKANLEIDENWRSALCEKIAAV